MSNVLIKLDKKIRIFSKRKFPFTNVIGLSRSFLAAGTLLTLWFNSSAILVLRNAKGRHITPMLHSGFQDYNFFLLFGYENVYLMRIIGIILLFLVISGYFIQITSIFHWWVSYSFFTFSSAVDGGDQIAVILTLLLIPLCLADPRKNHWLYDKPKESLKNIPGIFSVLLIRIQVAVIYFHSAAGKFFVEEWSNGTAIYYWLNHSFFGMPLYVSEIINNILANGLAVTLITYSAFVVEILMFLCLLSKSWLKRIMFPIGIIFHFSIVYFLGIFSFFFSMLACLVLYLLPFYKPLNLKKWSSKNMFSFI